MLTLEQLETSIRYAQFNFRDDAAKHLRVDKNFIRQNFDLTGKRILDFGCGMGGMTLWYAKNWDCTVFGVDLDGLHIQVANEMKARNDLNNVFFEKRDILERPLESQYDLIFMNDVAEHIPYPALEAILTQLKSCLAPGGQLFVSYPPWASPYASHVNRVTHLPWCQFLPEKILLHWIKRKNVPLTGEHESDLVSAYKGLNHLTHSRLLHVAKSAGLEEKQRLSHSILRHKPVLRHLNPRWFPLHFLITKEILVLG